MTNEGYTLVWKILKEDGELIHSEEKTHEISDFSGGHTNIKTNMDNIGEITGTERYSLGKMAG